MKNLTYFRLFFGDGKMLYFFLQPFSSTSFSPLINSSGAHTKNIINIDKMSIKITFNFNFIYSFIRSICSVSLEEKSGVFKKNSAYIKLRLSQNFEKMNFSLKFHIQKIRAFFGLRSMPPKRALSCVGVCF